MINRNSLRAGDVNGCATGEDAVAMAQLALEMQAATSKVYPFGTHRPPFKIRIGLHASDAIGGLIGTAMPR